MHYHLRYGSIVHEGYYHLIKLPLWTLWTHRLVSSLVERKCLMTSIQLVACSYVCVFGDCFEPIDRYYGSELNIYEICWDSLIV